MSTKLPKTPPSSPNPGEGQGESKRAIDEVIDTPEALRRLAKRVKGILDGMNGEPTALDHPGDHPSNDNNTCPNDNLDVPMDDPLFDISDFGCHEHVEEAKGSEEQKEKGALPNGTASKMKGDAKLAGTS